MRDVEPTEGYPQSIRTSAMAGLTQEPISKVGGLASPYDAEAKLYDGVCRLLMH